MAAIMSLIVLLTVQEWSEDHTGATVKFKDGSAGFIARTNPDYPFSLKALANSTKGPLAVNWGGKGILLELRPARRDRVSGMAELPDKSLRFVMTRMNGTPRLLPENPDFARIRSVATRSLDEKRDIWLAIQLPEFIVADARIADE